MIKHAHTQRLVATVLPECTLYTIEEDLFQPAGVSYLQTDDRIRFSKLFSVHASVCGSYIPLKGLLVLPRRLVTKITTC